uniref:Putative disease resistance protein RGA4 n=1 Tax=Aegilops tauschii TaxID=37682 RepID=R7WBB7_AEGTA
MDVAVSAAWWVVGKALGPVSDGFLEAWAASKDLGPNVDALKMELLYVQGMLNNTRGREIDNPALNELLQKLRQRGTASGNTPLVPNTDQADGEASGCIRKLASGALNTVRTVGKLFPCSSFPPVHDDVSGKSVLCGACIRKAPQQKHVKEARKLEFDRVDLSTRMKHIVEQLQPLCAKVTVILNLELLGSNHTTTTDIPKSPPTTTSDIIESTLYGRDPAKKRIIDIITDDKYSCDNLTILPIVGPGGIGKTTLIQHIYNSQEVKTHFQIKIWICVSQNFIVNKLIEDIEKAIPSVEGEKKGRAEELIEQRLNSKRFLLILDDIWKCESEDWKRLLVPLTKGQAKGNVILVTTRFPAIAEMVKTTDNSIDLKEHGEFRNFFRACIFGDEQSQKDHDGLLNIGDKIAEKLKGSPLAAKTVGRLLRNHLDVHHWTRVLESREWEVQTGEGDIMPALKLSYDYLPYHLRQCFSSCALFPEDYKFHSEELIHFWIGLDILHPGDQNKTIKDVGLDNLNDLVNSGFFKKDETEGHYVIHDLLHDFALKVASHEYLSLHHSNVRSIEIRPYIRHLSIVIDGPDDSNGITDEKFKSELMKLKAKLKILDLQEWYGSLLLPRDMSNLAKLCHFLAQQDELLLGIYNVGKLKLLQELKAFAVNKEIKGFELNQLEHLTELREVSIYNLEKIHTKEEAVEAKLIQKDYLHKLTLAWDSARPNSEPGAEVVVLESLQPHRNLQELRITGHRGPSCPTWLGDNLVVQALQSLLLFSVSWDIFPSFGKMWNLRELVLSNISTIKEFPLEQSFCKLVNIALIGLENFEKWVPGAGHLFPCLQVLIIKDCPQLSELPCTSHIVYPLKQDCNIDWFPKLEELRIQNCPEVLLLPPIPWTQSLCSVEIRDVGSELPDKLVYSKSSSGLSLEISGKGGLHNLDQLLLFSKLTELQELKIVNCPSLELKYFLMLTSLKKFTAWSSNLGVVPSEVQSGVEWQHPIEYISIGWSGVGHPQCWSGSSFPRSPPSPNYPLVRRFLFSPPFPLLPAGPATYVREGRADPSNLTSLTRLNISDCGEDLRCEGLLPLLTRGQLSRLEVSKSPNFFGGWDPNPMWGMTESKLQKLDTDDIQGFLGTPALCSLLSSSLTDLKFDGDSRMTRFTKEQEEAFHLLTSLQQLEFWNCGKLEHLPAGLNKFTNLKTLQIYDCPALLSLPKEGLPSSLRQLIVIGCRNEEVSLCLSRKQVEGEEKVPFLHQVDGQSHARCSYACSGWFQDNLQLQFDRRSIRLAGVLSLFGGGS